MLAGCCDPCNEKALRASRGAAFKLPLASGDWQVGGRQSVHLHGLRRWPIAELGLLSPAGPEMSWQCLWLFAVRLCGSTAAVLICSSGCEPLQELEHVAACHNLAFVGAEPHVAACHNLAFVGAEPHEPANDDAAPPVHGKGESVLHFPYGCLLISMCIQKLTVHHRGSAGASWHLFIREKTLHDNGCLVRWNGWNVPGAGQ